MNKRLKYSGTDKMCDLICENYNLLLVMVGSGYPWDSVTRLYSRYVNVRGCIRVLFWLL